MSHIHQQHLVEDIRKYAGDVQRYLKDKVQRLHFYDTYLQEHPRALLRLAELAQDDFTFARVAVDFLVCHEDADPWAHFELLFPDRDHNRLAPLDALYLRILRRTISRPGRCSTRTRRRPTGRWRIRRLCRSRAHRICTYLSVIPTVERADRTHSVKVGSIL